MKVTFWVVVIRILKKLLLWARRMFCKHHYVHLGEDRKIDKFYYWICTKCEKEKRTRTNKYDEMNYLKEELK